MKKFIIMIVVLVLFLAVNTFAEEKLTEEQVMMKKWMEYATPGKFHKSLEYFTGKWDAVTRYWMKPGDKPMKTTGTAVAKMIMGGRYLKTQNQGKMMGMEFTGLSIIGYDNYNKKFVGTWIDSNGTGMFPYEGTLDASGKVRIDTAIWDEIITGGKHGVRMVTTIVDKNTYKFDMYMKYPGAPEFKSMEMTYSRVKCNGEQKCCAKKKGDKENKCSKKKTGHHKKKCDHKKTGEVKKKCCAKNKGNKTKKCNKKK